MRLFLALLFASLSTTLLGQGVVPPFEVGQVNPLAGLGPGSMPGTNVYGVHFIHLPADPPNVFYGAATVTGLSTTHGGVGGADLLCGSYDVLTDTFTPNSEAAALNTGGTDWGMTLHHTGLFAVFERLFASSAWNEVWLASRPAIGQPWQIVGRIGPLPSSPGFFSPALADYHGETQLLYVHLFDIAMVPIDLTTAVLTDAPLVIVNGPPYPQVFAHTPIPVTDLNGELIGVSHSARDANGPSSDHFMSLDLDASTPAVLMNDVATWTAAGGFIGGRFFEAGTQIFAIDTFWFTGGRAFVGSTMDVRMFSPPTSGPEVYLSLFAASTGFLPVGQPFPPLLGLVGINAVGSWSSNLVLHNNLNGEAQASVPIPNVPALSGIRLPVQSATLEVGSGAVYLGNTAVLVVE